MALLLYSVIRRHMKSTGRYVEAGHGIDGARVETSDGVRFLRAAGSFGPDGKFKDALSLIMVIAVLASAHARQRSS